MNARTDLAVLAQADSSYVAIRESAARAQAGIFAPVMTTVSVVKEIGNFEEVIAAARASVAHNLATAKARRFFNDHDASQAVGEAEQFGKIVEAQIAAIERFSEVRDLLGDMASEPERRRKHFPRETVPEWATLFAARAGSLLRAIWR